MVRSIKELNFDEKMNNFITQVEEAYNSIAETEESDQTMIEWINLNVYSLEDEEILNNLTDREKFLFAFGILSSEIERRFNDNGGVRMKVKRKFYKRMVNRMPGKCVICSEYKNPDNWCFLCKVERAWRGKYEI